MADSILQFEAAVDAVIAGDALELKRLLSENPQLIRARSTRPHRAALLHYTAANGVEDERQKTPANIVELAETLLNAGAEVDAEADLYGGGSTTLGLAATSGHPERAGVQIALLETLLAHGASLAPENGAGNSHSLIEACLANGRKTSAEFLASRGAPISLRAAAGLGLLERLAISFKPGSVVPTTEELQQGFFWACQYGRFEVAQFLFARGASLTAADGNDQTALHHAILGGNVEIVEWLLTQNPPLDARNRFGGTPLGQAHWSAQNGGDDDAYRIIVASLLKAGAI